MNKFESLKRVSLIGIICNIFLFIIKNAVGLMTHSEAMIADAYNSFSDIVSSGMSYAGSKIASRGRDAEHEVGYGKAEYIFAFLISFIMIELGLLIIKSSITSFFNSDKLIYSNYLVIVSLVTIVIKLSLYIYTSRIAHKYDNILIKANSMDHRNDSIITIFNLFSAICLKNGIYIFDSIVGLIIGLWIIIQAFEIFLKSYDVLLDKAIDKDTKKKVLEIVNKHEEVKKVNKFRSIPVGYKYQVFLTIYVDGNLSTFDSYEIAHSLEKEIEKEIKDIHLVVIHVDPFQE